MIFIEDSLSGVIKNLDIKINILMLDYGPKELFGRLKNGFL